MKPEAQRIAIAEACGYSEKDAKRGFTAFEYLDGSLWGCVSVPDYLTDLNAMHKAEKVLTDEQQELYAEYMNDFIAPSIEYNLGYGLWKGVFQAIHVTADIKAQVFLRTIGKWDDSK